MSKKKSKSKDTGKKISVELSPEEAADIFAAVTMRRNHMETGDVSKSARDGASVKSMSVADMESVGRMESVIHRIRDQM